MLRRNDCGTENSTEDLRFEGIYNCVFLEQCELDGRGPNQRYRTINPVC